MHSILGGRGFFEPALPFCSEARDIHCVAYRGDLMQNPNARYSVFTRIYPLVYPVRYRICGSPYTMVCPDESSDGLRDAPPVFKDIHCAFLKENSFEKGCVIS